MEKKKLLLVAISVGVFLVIVIGAAVLAFSPGNRADRAVESRFVPVQEPVYPGTAPGEDEYELAGAPPDQPASIDAVDIIKNPSGGIQGLDPLPVNLGSPREDRFSLATGETRAGVPPVIISVPAPQGAAPAVRSSGLSSPGAAPAAAKAPSQGEPAAKPPVPAARVPVSAEGPSARTSSALSPAAKPPLLQSPSRTYDTFWIQTGSFSAKARAEGVQENLSTRGIQAIIENRDINGKTFFRVRIGPYTSKNEADYWLSLVKSIDGFEDSMVWQNRSRL
jgi:DedD protein